MVAPNTVEFYSKPDYQDSAKTANLEDVEHYVLGVNYFSYHLGNGTKLLVWDHSNFYDNKIWEQDQQSLPKVSPGSMQCYQVLRGEKHHASSVIGIRFKDATGGKPKAFLLILKLAKIGDVPLYSDESDKYAIGGTITQSGPPVTTAVYVRDETTKEYICNGSIFFKWDEENEKVAIGDTTNWPKELKITDDGKNNFTITLISTH